MRELVRGVGGVVGFVGMSLIIWNAIAQAIRDENLVLAAAEFLAFPVTMFVYPFLAPSDALAWPLGDGTSLIPVLGLTILGWAACGVADMDTASSR